jgi:hypothetical protein
MASRFSSRVRRDQPDLYPESRYSALPCSGQLMAVQSVRILCCRRRARAGESAGDPVGKRGRLWKRLLVQICHKSTSDPSSPSCFSPGGSFLRPDTDSCRSICWQPGWKKGERPWKRFLIQTYVISQRLTLRASPTRAQEANTVGSAREGSTRWRDTRPLGVDRTCSLDGAHVGNPGNEDRRRKMVQTDRQSLERQESWTQGVSPSFRPLIWRLH